MRKLIILASVIVAGFAAAGFAEHDLWVPFLACIGWMLLTMVPRRKKPRVAAQGSDERTKNKIVNFYDTTVEIGTQAWQDTPAGKSLTKVYYLE